jgi:hypothetical protein
MLAFGSVRDLIALALALGARGVEGWSENEESAVDTLPPVPLATVSAARQAILRGDDPLGDTFCGHLTAEQRRPLGATYTPQAVISAMLAWAATQIDPARIVDPGAGSARFLVAAGRKFPNAQLVAVEIDPLAATLARGHLAAAGLRDRSQVILGDYRETLLRRIDGPTLYLGNPPYVRHHLVAKRWKTWLTETARAHGFTASQLAGLHVHFFLAIADSALKGDVGVLITAAEWLDVNYGRLVRELLVGPLGVKTIHVIEPAAMPFVDAATTAVITGFEVGNRPKSIGLRRVETLGKLESLHSDWQVRRERLEQSDRWTPLTRPAQDTPTGFIELGELCRVHRGQVTGANNIWIAGTHARDLPKSVLFHTVTRARELFAVNGVLADPLGLRKVIDLPVDLDEFDTIERSHINKFLMFAKASGADGGFIASHRKAWWSVGLREPAPILATYMARRPPAFIRNLANARHINIAHGLYPREPLAETVLRGLGTFLSRHTSLNQGRAYAGGLTKFEPREMERLKVPRPELLADAQFLESLL